MLTTKQLFLADGLDVSEDAIKLVRHVGRRGRSIRQIADEGHLELYQEEQSAKIRPFDRCRVILSFLGVEGNKAEFYGAYEVRRSRPYTPEQLAALPDWMREGHREDSPAIRYELRELERFRAYRRRLVVQWKSSRVWVQKKDLDIYELLPATLSTLFPGYQDVLLSFDELKWIFADPRAHRDWKSALESNAGIYRIVDLSTGKIYIGSAYGSGGIWGRWQNYARTGHGGNKLLKDCNPANFQWSIVRTVSTAMSPRDVIRIEAREKAKHGSKAIGLNGN